VPLARRVRQIELTLERWRWLPDTVPARYAVVNIPGFRLYMFQNDPAAAHPELRMNVIVGQAGRRGTPVFTGTMQQVVFRPYWDVPLSIARKETLRDIRRKPGYMEREELEIVRGGDDAAVVHAPTARNLDRVAAGTMRIRQRPGPKNALGLVKFVFPNDYNVYLHGTPAQQLFAESRRDFSHGCIRVEDPPALAELVLRGQAGWDRAAIEAAMADTVTRRVRIERPIAVYILYQTVVVGEDGVVRVYRDVYGYDARLERVLGSEADGGGRYTVNGIR
jgi:murein L,D-transpeptidase YcbB/YkuD